MLSLCNNLLKLALNGFLTQKEMMKKMVLPAEGHHTGKVGQSDQLTSHLCSDNCDEASLGYATQNQGGRTWQAFGGGKHDHETFRQARNYNFRDKCVVFARNLKFSNLTQ